MAIDILMLRYSEPLSGDSLERGEMPRAEIVDLIQTRGVVRPRAPLEKAHTPHTVKLQ